MVHYEIGGEHFGDRGEGATTSTHEAAKAVRSAARKRRHGAGLADLQIWGTPARCLEKIEHIQRHHRRRRTSNCQLQLRRHALQICQEEHEAV
ncbi:MAG: hypothetical protein IPN63_06455 [Gammaproteobacteria bacterium]|nr:hypothetical protein [Gammaproteobacteria bacterium]